MLARRGIPEECGQTYIPKGGMRIPGRGLAGAKVSCKGLHGSGDLPDGRALLVRSRVSSLSSDLASRAAELVHSSPPGFLLPQYSVFKKAARAVSLPGEGSGRQLLNGPASLMHSLHISVLYF